VRIKDGVVESMVGYVAVPFWKWFENIAFA